MIEFKTVAVEDKDWIDEILKREDARNADCNFTNLYVWSQGDNRLVAPYKDRLVIKLGNKSAPFYSFPYGSGELESVILAMKVDADSDGVPFVIKGIIEENVELLEKTFPGKFQITEHTDIFDYVYLVEKLSTLAGKKLHSKRNHINRFLENNEWTTEMIDEGNIPICIELCKKWSEENTDTHSTKAERIALTRVFDNYTKLGLEGMILRSSLEPIAFTIGERLNSDTFIAHFEKAESSVQGAYPMINREFSRYVAEKYPDIIYLNREDDMGHENLRKAKKSYYPEFMVKKHTAVHTSS